VNSLGFKLGSHLVIAYRSLLIIATYFFTNSVWGEIQDSESFAVIDHVWTLPTEEQDGLAILQQPLHFSVEIVQV
jgi:hypothetical protein